LPSAPWGSSSPPSSPLGMLSFVPSIVPLIWMYLSVWRNWTDEMVPEGMTRVPRPGFVHHLDGRQTSGGKEAG